MPSIVMWVASPHTSAQMLHAVAAMTPTEMRVSMEAVRCLALSAATRWNGQAAHVTTGMLSAPAHHCQFVNCAAGTMDSTTTGTENTAATVRRRRSAARRSSRPSS